MEIKINQEEVQAALDNGTTTAIKNAFEGYSMRNAIEKVLAEAVLPDVMGTAIRGAVDLIDAKALQGALSAQMSRSITKSVQFMLQEATINMIMDLRKIPDYDKPRREIERAKIIAELDGKI